MRVREKNRSVACRCNPLHVEFLAAITRLTKGVQALVSEPRSPLGTTRPHQNDVSAQRKIHIAKSAQTRCSRRVDLASRRSLQTVAQMASQHFARLQRPLRRIRVLIANLLQHAGPLHHCGLDRRSSREGRYFGTPRAIRSTAGCRRHTVRHVGTILCQHRMARIVGMREVITAACMTGLLATQPNTQ